jgi:hypothetical protein
LRCAPPFLTRSLAAQRLALLVVLDLRAVVFRHVLDLLESLRFPSPQMEMEMEMEMEMGTMGASRRHLRAWLVMLHHSVV